MAALMGPQHHIGLYSYLFCSLGSGSLDAEQNPHLIKPGFQTCHVRAGPSKTRAQNPHVTKVAKIRYQITSFVRNFARNQINVLLDPKECLYRKITLTLLNCFRTYSVRITYMFYVDGIASVIIYALRQVWRQFSRFLLVRRSNCTRDVRQNIQEDQCWNTSVSMQFC